MRAAILTAYTADYTLGKLCSPINRAYAAKHGYTFIEKIIERPEERHPTWAKVQLLNELMIDDSFDYILWIDADAVVIRQDRSLDELIQVVPSTSELIIGEDVTESCLVNAGVLLVKVSDWSRNLWTDVWASEQSRKYYHRKFHEQSSLLKQLNMRQEQLTLVSPFHSFRGGPEVKHFPHVTVMPRHAFNSNKPDQIENIEFIFHAAGKLPLGKKETVINVIKQVGLADLLR